MKKFSKLIQESKSDESEKHPLVNPVDWDEIFKPLIEHIEGNLKSKVPYPGEGVFSDKTKGYLDELIDSITEDYVEYYQNVIDDGSQESFLNAWNINCDYKDIIDCVQPLLDNSDDVEDNPNWDGGYVCIEVNKIKYKQMSEFLEDIEDVHLKLKMLKTGYKIVINGTSGLSNNFYIKDTDTDITTKLKDSVYKKTHRDIPDDRMLNYFDGVTIFVYNKDTVQTPDLD